MGFNDAGKGAVADKTDYLRNESKLPPKRKRKYKPRAVETSTGVRCVKPNMSRRTGDTKLYVFPSFDRCDSLLFFPSTLARHLNSGDIPAVKKLFQSYLDKNCEINYVPVTHYQMTAAVLFRIYDIRNDLYPDLITCIYNTEIEGNVIRAVGFSKFTYCKAVYNSVVGTIHDEPFVPMSKRSWQEHLHRKVKRENKPPAESEHYLALVDSGCDLLMYTRTEFTLTVDDVTKKIKSLVLNASTTSMQPAKYDVDML